MGQNKTRWSFVFVVHCVNEVGIQCACTCPQSGAHKNTCDRLFNLLKMEWRQTNVYTPKQLELLLEGALSCESVQCGYGFFKDRSNYI